MIKLLLVQQSCDDIFFLQYMIVSSTPYKLILQKLLDFLHDQYSAISMNSQSKRVQQKNWVRDVK